MTEPRSNQAVASRLPMENGSNDSSANKDWSSGSCKLYRKWRGIMRPRTINLKLKALWACEGLSVVMSSLYFKVFFYFLNSGFFSLLSGDFFFFFLSDTAFIKCICTSEVIFQIPYRLLSLHLHPVVACITKLIHTLNWLFSFVFGCIDRCKITD